jgi:hypothetical protein
MMGMETRGNRAGSFFFLFQLTGGRTMGAVSNPSSSKLQTVEEY